MGKFSKEDIFRLIDEQDIRFIRLQFTDIFGILKNVAITPGQLEDALAGQCMFDGSSIEGFVRVEESDMVLRPDLDTFVIFPWRPQQSKVARLICDVYTPDGEPFAGDPRHILKNVQAEAAAMGFTLNVGPECEFFLFQYDESGRPTVNSQDEGSYFDLEPIGQGEDVRREAVLALEDMGFRIEASHHEVAPGQHEIDFRFNEVLKAADDIQTFKLAIKSVARRYGLHASFMPKPISGVSGSGMHCHLSLLRDGVNAFHDPSAPDGLSQLARNFVAGLFEHVRGMSAIVNPLVNSYKRLVPGYEAPCYIAWSSRNRSPLIRIPAAGGENTRIELRNPDPSCNPYLALALMLSAGLDGIKRNLLPVPPVDVNIYQLSASERDARGIASLPASLNEALDEMERDEWVASVLGSHINRKFLEAKRQEWNSYRSSISQWELESYLRKY